MPRLELDSGVLDLSRLVCTSESYRLLFWVSLQAATVMVLLHHRDVERRRGFSTLVLALAHANAPAFASWERVARTADAGE
mmetsp:Transcript_163655/g.524782  ORF Transcript_163655/g.524782 Transcript_163655/m.524782 type:complete len:81 (+) Transcript_163655:253-495(+)